MMNNDPVMTTPRGEAMLILAKQVDLFCTGQANHSHDTYKLEQGTILTF